MAATASKKCYGWNDEMVEYLLNSLNLYKASKTQEDLHNIVFSMIREILMMKSICFYKDKQRRILSYLFNIIFE